MKLEGDIESGAGGIPGIKLPNDGSLGFFPNKLSVSKQMLIDWLSKSRERIRPWTTFFASSNFKAPVSAQRLPRRIVKNVEYFQSNYLFVFIGLFIYCMITSPLLFLAVMGSFGVCYYLFTKSLERRAVLFGKELTLVQQYCMVGLCSLPVFYIVGAGAALFWVLGASFFLIMTHAIFYDITAILEPEEDSFELTMEQVV